MEYLTIPFDENTPSPSSSMGRHFRALLPAVSTNQNLNVSESLVDTSPVYGRVVMIALWSEWPEIPIGSMVSYCNHVSNIWPIGKVINCDARSYIIRKEKVIDISRNHIHLKPINVPYSPNADGNTPILPT